MTYKGGSFNVLMNPATNQMSGFNYDGNGNLKLGNWSYDVENRLISVDAAGGENYMYDPSNKRIYKQNNSGVYNGGGETYYFYGLDGKVMGEYGVLAGSGGTMSLGVGMESAYFGGRKVVPSMPRDRLGSVRAWGGTANHPYGENYSGNNTDGFATYYQDSSTGLNYADQRYYGGIYGRFMTPDPSGDNWDSWDPLSWNMYSYTEGDPINYYDPFGLLACGDLTFTEKGNPQSGKTLSSILNGTSDLGLLADTIFTESGESTSASGAQEMGAIAATVMNRWQVLNGYWWLKNTKGVPIRFSPDWGPAGASISQILWAPNQFAVWQSPGQLAPSAQANLNAAENSADGSSQCTALAQAFFTADYYLDQESQHQLYTDSNGLVYTSFNSNSNSHAPSMYETKIGSYGSANVFYGIPFSQAEYVPSAYGTPIPLGPRPTKGPRKPLHGGRLAAGAPF